MCRTGIAGPYVRLCFTIYKKLLNCCKMTVLRHNLTSSEQEFQVLHQHLALSGFLDFSHSHKCIVPSRCFTLHFLSDKRYWTSFTSFSAICTSLVEFRAFVCYKMGCLFIAEISEFVMYYGCELPSLLMNLE